jgi:protocatechuate 3,4-dioxygenase beta subunit
MFFQHYTTFVKPVLTVSPDVQGELVRKDVTEDQDGVPLTLDIQLIDVNTCEPISDIYLEVWNCNSTGVYSGVNTNGNGNSADTTNIDNTFLRGIQKADDDGVITFDTIFPGHYQGRATHIHIMGHIDATVGDNKTLSSQGSIAHVGQIFFDQELITEIDTVEPYASNDQGLTLNTDDMIASQAAEDVDPFAEYVLLGDSISDGLLAWTVIGVNVTANHSVSAAATIYADGGVANANAMMGGPDAPGGGRPNGTFNANGTATAAGTGAELSSTSTSTGTETASVATSTSSSEAHSAANWYGKVVMAVAGVGAILF